MDTEDVIVVVGVGSAEVEPDRVRALVGVSTVAPSVAEALTAAAAAQQRILGVLLAAGVPRSSIQTAGYQAGHDYEAGATSSRHRADTTLAIVLADVGRASELLAAISDAAGESFRINGVHPESSDLEPARRVARRAAVAAARAQAEELADAAGVRLGRLRSLAEGVGGGAPFHDLRARPMALAAAPGVEGGELTVRVAVTATYEIVAAGSGGS